MKRKHKGIQNFLFLAISVFLFVMPALQECDDLLEIELIFPTPSFEKPHPEDMGLGREGGCQGLSNISAMMLLLATNPINQVSHHSYPIISSNQQSPLLRC